MTNSMDEWQEQTNARMANGPELGSPAALQAEIERLRAALKGVVDAWVNPYDGGDYERGEIPELDAARDALNQQRTNTRE